MAKVIDLTHYQSKADLELCLQLVQGALGSLQKKHYDLAEDQLLDILETFSDTLEERQQANTVA